MYAGCKVEERATADLLRTPLHPYTRGLIAARPRLGADHGFRARLTEIPGMVPSLRDMPRGCRFAPRCPLGIEACQVAPPPLIPVGAGGSVACLRIEESRVSKLAFGGAGAS
jgi:peptide/nickel transport system ATP-binding protein